MHVQRNTIETTTENPKDIIVIMGIVLFFFQQGLLLHVIEHTNIHELCCVILLCHACSQVL